MNNNIRNGDILLVPTSKVEGKKVSKGKSYVLAYGEQTGHKHLLTASPQDTAFEVREKDGELTFVLGKMGQLTHEEHKQLTVSPGTYRVVHEREYNHFQHAVRRVVD